MTTPPLEPDPALLPDPALALGSTGSPVQPDPHLTPGGDLLPSMLLGFGVQPYNDLSFGAI